MFIRKILLLLVFVNCLSCNSIKPEHDRVNEGYWHINGQDLFYKTTGEGQPVIVLHGGPGLSHKYLYPQLDSLLSDNYQLIFYDQRASGWSGGIDDTASLTMETFVEDLEMVRKELGFEQMNLMGHSFGGLLAMYYGIKYPEYLRSLVLVDSDAASWERRTPFQIKMIRERLTEADWKGMENLELAGAFSNNDPVMIEKYFRIFLKSYFADPSDVSKLELGFDSILVSKNEITSTHIRDNLADSS